MMKNPKELSSCTHTLPHAGNVLWGTKGEGFSPERSRQRGIKEQKLLLCASLELVKKYKKTPIAMPSVYWQAKPST
jgi:hypothetical protein